MSNFNSFKITNPAYEAVQKMQSSGAIAAAIKIQESTAFAAAMKMEASGAFAAVRELQKTLQAVRVPLNGATAMLEEYHKTLAPIRESLNLMHTAYAPIFEATKTFDSLNMKGLIAGLKTSMPAMTAISKMDLVGFASIVDSLPKYDFLSSINMENFTIKEAEELFENGEITQEDINDEFVDIVTNKKFSPKAEWDKIQKSKWFLAIRLLICIVAFLGQPLTDYVGDKVRDAIGVTQLIEECELYDVIDDIFECFEDDKETVTEEEAKQTVDTTKTGNISKQKREDLLAKIKEIRTFISAAPQDENTGNLLSYLSELEKDVNGKKYGLVFEEHREEIDEVLDTHTPVLTENEELFIDNGGQMNFLIEGDNLASLKLLEKTHKGKIDVIYIDPPYNTGATDWRYNNEFVDGNDSFRHSKWVSWLKNRIIVSKKLLSQTGIIVVTIDDYEVASLRLLLDEIFGNENYLGTVVIRNNPSGRSTVRGLSINHEYALFYSSSQLSMLGRMEHNDEQKSRYSEKDDIGFFEWENFRKNGTDSDRKDRPKQFYPIILDEITKKLRIPQIAWNDNSRSYKLLEEPSENEIILYPITKGNEKVWKYGLERTKTIINELLIKKTKMGYELYRKKYLNTEGSLPRTWWDKPEYSARDNGTRTLTNLFGPKKVFDFPKAPEAVKDSLIAANLKKDGIVLDFFAGSGTTAQATLELNKKDNGNRRFILCTNNENNICRDVTYERIRRVIDKEGYEASLKYYRVEYIPVSERMYYEYADELLRHIRELVELENGVDFTNNAEIAIVLTEEELEEFVANIEDFSKCKKLYMGHDLLPTEEQEQAISSHEIEVNIIPDYYYRDLQEG